MLTSIAITFAVSMVMVLGIYWAFVVLPEDTAARRLRKRLRPDARPAGPKGEGLTKSAPAGDALKGLDALLGRSGRVIDPLRRTVEHSGLPLTIGLIVVGAGIAAAVVFLGVLVMTSTTWLAAVAAIGAGSAPILLVRSAAARRIRMFEDQFPQAIDLIAGSLRAGHAFTTGVSMVADEVPEPTAAEFRLLYDHQNYGMPLPDALKAFGRRVPLLDARFFITAVLTQREAGGNLAEVLDNLSSLIRERSRVKRQVRVASAHGRITGWILSLMPPVLAVVMTLLAPQHMRAFIEDPLGVRMIIGALILQAIGVFAIRRIVDVEF
jgi:tight adherence protein B